MKRLSEDSEDEEDPVKEFVRSVRFDIESEAHKNSNSPAAGRVRLSINRSVSMSLLHAKSVSRREEVCRNIDNLIFCLKTDLNNLSNSAEILIHLGSPSRTRTYDPRINSPLLYQLSYRGINKEFI